jgi:hypothetical protein
MSIITTNPAPLAAGQRARVASAAVVSAYINELAGSARPREPTTVPHAAPAPRPVTRVAVPDARRRTARRAHRRGLRARRTEGRELSLRCG